MNYADEIKTRLTASEVFQYYGFHPNRAGFVCCPLHGEKTPSLKIYDDGRGWVCFGCHKGGDVINFVRELFGLSYKEAVAKINEDFFLGLDIGQRRSGRQRLEDARKSYERKKQFEEREKERKRLNDEYWSAFDRWKLFDDNRRKYAPKSCDEEFHPLFVEAVQNINIAEFELELAESRLGGYHAVDDADSTRVFSG